MTPENEAKKQYLLRYRQAEREVRLLMEEKERLLALATKVTPSYSGEAKGSGSGSRVESAAEKIIQCEEEISRAIDCAVDLRCEIKGGHCRRSGLETPGNPDPPVHSGAEVGAGGMGNGS